MNLDTDGDGLGDYEENSFGTNPNNPDTDEDELEDGHEMFVYGTDPFSLSLSYSLLFLFFRPLKERFQDKIIKSIHMLIVSDQMLI